MILPRKEWVTTLKNVEDLIKHTVSSHCNRYGVTSYELNHIRQMISFFNNAEEGNLWDNNENSLDGDGR